MTLRTKMDELISKAREFSKEIAKSKDNLKYAEYLTKFAVVYHVLGQPEAAEYLVTDSDLVLQLAYASSMLATRDEDSTYELDVIVPRLVADMSLDKDRLEKDWGTAGAAAVLTERKSMELEKLIESSRVTPPPGIVREKDMLTLMKKPNFLLYAVPQYLELYHAASPFLKRTRLLAKDKAARAHSLYERIIPILEGIKEQKGRYHWLDSKHKDVSGHALINTAVDLRSYGTDNEPAIRSAKYMCQKTKYFAREFLELYRDVIRAHITDSLSRTQ